MEQGFAYHPLEPEVVMPLHQPVPVRPLGCMHQMSINTADYVVDFWLQWGGIKIHKPLLAYYQCCTRKNPLSSAIACHCFELWQGPGRGARPCSQSAPDLLSSGLPCFAVRPHSPIEKGK